MEIRVEQHPGAGSSSYQTTSEGQGQNFRLAQALYVVTG
jgi:hypothetical protein